MSAVRRPRRREITLASMLVDFEASLQGGDTLCAVEVPGVEWNLLLQCAQDELEQQELATATEAARLERVLNYPGSIEQWTVAERNELSELRAFKAKHEAGWIDLQQAHGAAAAELVELRAFKASVERKEATFGTTPPRIDAWADTQQVRLLLDSGDGCILTIDQGLKLAAELDVECSKAHAPPKAEKRKRSRSKKACDHCGEADGHTEEECFLKPQGAEVKGFAAVPPPKVHTKIYRTRKPKTPPPEPVQTELVDAIEGKAS